MRRGEWIHSHNLRTLLSGNDEYWYTPESSNGGSSGSGSALKISSNSEIAEKKPHWIDFNAGRLLDGTASMDELTDELFDLILRVASGDERARNELNDYREIAIWKEGVTL